MFQGRAEGRLGCLSKGCGWLASSFPPCSALQGGVEDRKSSRQRRTCACISSAPSQEGRRRPKPTAGGSTPPWGTAGLQTRQPEPAGLRVIPPPSAQGTVGLVAATEHQCCGCTPSTGRLLGPDNSNRGSRLRGPTDTIREYDSRDAGSTPAGGTTGTTLAQVKLFARGTRDRVPVRIWRSGRADKGARLQTESGWFNSSGRLDSRETCGRHPSSRNP